MGVLYYGDIDISLLTHPEDYYLYEDEVFFYATVQESRQLINPFKEGYELYGGQVYEASVAMTQIERLPPPYSTNCFDYIKAWKENNGSGPTTQAECIQYCNLETASTEDLCITERIYISHTNRVCPFWLIATPVTSEDDIIKKCTQRCQPACLERI
nr:uncharacterized protein LOC122270294 [Parasteatoda tepidariorum]